MVTPDNRRPVAARSSGWAQRLARLLLRTSITPNQISMVSVLASAAGATAVMTVPGPASAVFCALLIPVRLICNLIDGMVAIEGGRHSAVGALYNDIPDRVSDALVMIAIGVAAHAAALGWAAALFAVGTAYVRLLGGSLGLQQDYRGPLAKQTRMWVACAGLLLAAGAPAVDIPASLPLTITLWILAVGGALTCANRTLAIAEALRNPK